MRALDAAQRVYHIDCVAGRQRHHQRSIIPTNIRPHESEYERAYAGHTERRISRLRCNQARFKQERLAASSSSIHNSQEQPAAAVNDGSKHSQPGRLYAKRCQSSQRR